MYLVTVQMRTFLQVQYYEYAKLVFLRTIIFIFFNSFDDTCIIFKIKIIRANILHRSKRLVSHRRQFNFMMF